MVDDTLQSYKEFFKEWLMREWENLTALQNAVFLCSGQGVQCLGRTNEVLFHLDAGCMFTIRTANWFALEEFVLFWSILAFPIWVFRLSESIQVNLGIRRRCQLMWRCQHWHFTKSTSWFHHGLTICPTLLGSHGHPRSRGKREGLPRVYDDILDDF